MKDINSRDVKNLNMRLIVPPIKSQKIIQTIDQNHS